MRLILRLVALCLGIPILLIVLIVIFFQVEPGLPLAASNFREYPKSFESVKGNINLDSLKENYGAKKQLPPGYEIQALLALSAYPQLTNVSIKMTMTTSGAPMESNFEFWTLFGPKSSRIYDIRLNDSQGSMFDAILLRELPFDAQVGILAHELGHVLYYDQLNTLQIANWGIKYLLDSEFRSQHEKNTDLIPVQFGLGWQIHEYARYVRESEATQTMYMQYAEFIDGYYLTHHEIMTALKDDGGYH